MDNGYKINPAAYNGVTVLPACVVSDHIKLANAAQLKTVLYVFSEPSAIVDCEKVAKAVGIKPEDAKDALEYWQRLGILLAENGTLKTEEPKQLEPEPEPPKPVKQYNDVKPARLRMDEIAARINESEEVRLLFSEAQMCLGRTIGSGDQSSLLLLHDYYGLPVEIILTICEFAKTHGKASNMNYIFTVGQDWSRREIDTIERANDELKKIESINSHWGEFCSVTGIHSSKPTSAQSKYIGVWLNEWNFPMSVIALAFEEMTKNTAGKISFPYINKVLSAWYMKGIKTPEDVAAEQKAFAEQKERQAAAHSSAAYGRGKKPAETTQKASYDIEKAEQKAKTTIPKLVKKEKR